MTPKEAIAKLNDRHMNVSMCISADECREDNEALDMAIEALEKQISKKPIYEDTDNIYGAMKRTCTNCGDVVMVSPQARPFELYCRYCGTRLVDWTEGNE